ncbi:MAG: phage major capsid protein [Alphaproteobacteria bacterium]|nr:phage major capsid protein [Alphaproteobacteria bacterium]
MQISEIKDRLDKLSGAWEEFKFTNDQRLKQVEQKGSADVVTENKLSNINTALDEYKSRLQMLELKNARPVKSIDSRDNLIDSEYKNAFSDYLRKGNETLVSNLSRKSLSGVSNAEGGYLIDNAMYQFIYKNLESRSVMRQLCSIQEISTDSFDILSDDGNFDAGWVSEVEQRNDTKNANISKKNIPVHEIYAQPKVSQKLIDDSKIDISKWLSERLAEKFMYSESASFIIGDGNHKPRGILTYPSGKGANEIEQLSVKSEDGVIDVDSIINLYYSLDAQYSGNASFLMHRDMLQQIRLLKSDSTGHYLWSPGLESKSPDTLLGVPVYESADMPVPKKGSLSIALADFKSAYMIVDRAGINLMRDPYTEKPFVKFYTTKRVGGDIINTNAIKLLTL